MSVMTADSVTFWNQRYLDSIAGIVRGIGDGHRAVFTDLSWDEYQVVMTLRDRERPRIRLTYDTGRLEVMSTSYQHESWKRTVGRIFEMLTFHFGIRVRSAGNMTIQREDLKKGFEPDECYYVTNLEQLKGVVTIDFQMGPVPDLGIESEHSRNIIDRLPMYAAIGIREVWRCDRGEFAILTLDGGAYVAASESAVIPGVPARFIAEFLRRSDEIDETTLCHEMLARLKLEYPMPTQKDV